MTRKLILLILITVIFSCGKQTSTPKSKINEKAKQKIEAELKEINNSMSETEIDNMMTAEKGHKPSKHNLALLYRRLARYEEATKLFHEIGLTEGDEMYYAGMYYKTKKDYKKAEEIYNEMIAKGNLDGYFGLGQMYEDKFKNKKKALEFYEKGAELNKAKSTFKTGYIFFDTRNYEKAEKYFLIVSKKRRLNYNV